MEEYRVLLVDDEEDIRVGIGRKMDWTALGFALVGEAENGLEALDLAEALEPDVVLTDIKMPFMDGLELCRILTERLPAAKFVVFSGFDEFEYAKRAIRMNVFEYILKPISAAELGGVLRRLKDRLDTERTERQNTEALRRRYEESLPVLRELFYAHLLEGRVPPDQAAERAARLELDVTGDAWAAALAHVDGAPDRELAALSVQQLLDENLALEGWSCRAFLYGDAAAVLAVSRDGGSVYALIQALDRVCALAESYLGLTLTMGVGAPCAGLGELAQSAAGARAALDYRGLVGAGRAIYIGDLEPGAGVRISFDENDERELAGAVRLGGEAEVREAVDRLTEKVRRSGLAASQCNLFFLELLTCLLRLARGAGLEVEEVFGTGFTGAVQATDFSSFTAMGAWCLERCLRIQALFRRQRTDSAGQTVERAKAYIREHYGESDLSVERLCDHLHLSPAYFSTLFKRETGMSFTAHVTVIRMEAAAEALRNSEDKTYLIARRCGYEDANYFSYVFKKHFGVTPTKYRAGAL
ncbi:helix-turn-helix domain-containing protein [Oscillibacter sp. 1-3]|uniref:response regulator transcription factor n=1 Tax=Oscillibacter sp. 1-3 TaxID=1235797 RepID=UPI00033A08DE|nr:helix-turn-helix domain-containing protein [Oscillibacter sp. 1-3]EOS65348.1 hypothetical protein C816_02129 [Oscillibacter sp. 1-3]MCI9511862.1 response regulator [Oscillibacter sp.]